MNDDTTSQRGVRPQTAKAEEPLSKTGGLELISSDRYLVVALPRMDVHRVGAGDGLRHMDRIAPTGIQP